MKYLLDTNAIIAIMNGQDHFIERLKQHQPDDFGISAIVMHELYYGVFKSQRQQENLARVENIRFQNVEFDREDAHSAGKIRAFLAKAGTPIGPLDVLIAGQALARSLILVTRNEREFNRIQNLQIENWH